MAVAIKVESGKVTLALEAFRLGIMQRQDLLATLALGQLESIYKTFDDQGSPVGSWVPLAASTLKKKKYGVGHKILIDRGILRNSIRTQIQGDDAVIGTNLVYARVHQFGSRDRSGGFIGPQARIAGRSVTVKAHEYDAAYRTPAQDVWGKGPKGGRMRMFAGMRFGRTKVGEHQRFQNIPARPFLVFRPEDPERMVVVTQRFLVDRARAAGLEVTEE